MAATQLPETTTEKSFEERMTDRVRPLVGEMMTDGELKAILERTLENVFFKSKPDPNWRGMGQPKMEPPFIEKIVRETLTEQVNILVKEWLKENDDRVMEVVKEVLGDGMFAALTGAFQRHFQSELIMFSGNIENRIRNGGF